MNSGDRQRAFARLAWASACLCACAWAASACENDDTQGNAKGIVVAPVADSSTPGPDATADSAQDDSSEAASSDTGTDAPGQDASSDATDSGDAGLVDAKPDSGSDASTDAETGTDAGPPGVAVGNVLFASATPRAVALRGNEVVVVGYFSGTVDFGGGNLTTQGVGNDIFVAKYTLAGAHLWSKRLGGGNDDGATAVAFDSATGDVFVTGYIGPSAVDLGGGAMNGIAPDAFLLKLGNAAGAHVWSKRLVSMSGAYGHGIAVNAAGDIAVVADFAGTIDPGNNAAVAALGGSDTFAGKYNGATGALVWSKPKGSTGGDRFDSVAFDPNGDVICGGFIQGNADFGGGAIATATFKAVAVKYAGATGNHVWSFGYGSGAGTNVTGVGTDAAGNVFLAGAFGGAIDFGGGALNSAGGLDGYVAKLTSAGAHVWSKRYGGATDDSFSSLATAPSGDLVVGGYFGSSIDFGGGLLNSLGGNDGFAFGLSNAGAYSFSSVLSSAGQEQVYGVSAIATRAAFAGTTGTQGAVRVVTR